MNVNLQTTVKILEATSIQKCGNHWETFSCRVRDRDGYEFTVELTKWEQDCEIKVGTYVAIWGSLTSTEKNVLEVKVDNWDRVA